MNGTLKRCAAQQTAWRAAQCPSQRRLAALAYRNLPAYLCGVVAALGLGRRLPEIPCAFAPNGPKMLRQSRLS